MVLDEITISRAIIESYTRKLPECLKLDAAVRGAGP
jgi:thiamine thiazole synthase